MAWKWGSFGHFHPQCCNINIVRKVFGFFDTLTLKKNLKVLKKFLQNFFLSNFLENRSKKAFQNEMED